MENVKKLSEIEANPILRSLTGFQELDYIYGNSKFSKHTQWGMPQGKISLWSGDSGTGKSRLCIDVVKRWSKMYNAGKILYFMTEAPLGDFASWAKDTSQFSNVYCSGEDQIDKIIEIIYQIKPQLIFIDSVNELEDFTVSAKFARRLIKGEDGKPGLKQVMNDVGGHLVMLGQLNGDGSIKGGTSLPHMVDIALDFIPYKGSDDFIVKVGIKNRYGKKNAQTIFTHIDAGVINVCESRLSDKTWRATHGVPAPIKRTGVYIGEDGLPTDTITPAMQRGIDKQRQQFKYIPTSHRKKKGTITQIHENVGDFFAKLFGQ